MSEFRQNLATKEWVILAPGRGGRPRDMSRQSGSGTRSQPPHKEDCPFCRGNEEMTTAPVWTAPATGEWQVRVVPNKYAALSREAELDRSCEGRFFRADGFGLADVVIEHPVHNVSPATMTREHVGLYLEAYRERWRAIHEDKRLNLVTVFRNHGPRAGTSLEHPHSQIIATPIVPPHVRDSLTSAAAYFDTHGRCVYCDMIEEERAQGVRMVAETEHFAAFCPYASRSPYECRIYPKRHSASYLQIDDAEIQDLAGVLRGVLGQLYVLLDDPDYNYIVRSAPAGDHEARYLHWYMVVIPRVSTAAGFELGAGIFINTVAPEQSAAELREVEEP